MAFASPWLLILSIAGITGGLLLVVRGMRSYQAALRVDDTSTSTISSVAAGEVRISGVIEPVGVTLVSLLQSVACVYYRASVGAGGNAYSYANPEIEERSVGFRVRDSTGSLRVFPSGARIEAPVRFDDETGMAGEQPPGLNVRTGDPSRPTEIDRATAIADLLTVHPASSQDVPLKHEVRSWPTLGRRRYREARLEPGDVVTIVGRALPYKDWQTLEGDPGMGAGDQESDPEVAADLAEARAEGTLSGDPEDGWGNAAIPGFGIGRPVTKPEVDPDANPFLPGTPEQALFAERRFEIEPETLILAASDEVPLLIAYGTPIAVVGRGQIRFNIGLLGAVLAIASALVLAVLLSGGVGP